MILIDRKIYAVMLGFLAALAALRWWLGTR